MKTQALFGPMLIAATIALGLGVVWLAGWGLLFSLLFSLLDSSREPSVHLLNENLALLGDGTPIIQTYSPRGDPARPWTFRDREGNSVAADSEWLSGALLIGPTPFMNPWGLLWSERIRGFSGRSFGVPAVEPVDWYLVHDGRREGSAYFVGYDAQTFERVGFIGTVGFRADELAKDERFQIPAWHMRYPASTIMSQGYWSTFVGGEFANLQLYLVAAGELYEVTLRERTVRVITSRVAQPVISAGYIVRQAGPGRVQIERLVIRTADRIVLLNEQGDELRSMPIPADLEREQIAWYELAGSRSIVHVTGELDDEGSRRDRLVWLDAAGNVDRTERIELRIWAYAGDRSFGTNSRFALANLSYTWLCPSPLCVDLFALIVTVRSNMDSVPSSVTILDFWPTLIAVHLLGLVFAATVYRHSGRQALGAASQAAWCMFVFVFGLPGLIGYLLHRAWPVREVCTVCAQRTPRDREACTACGAEVPMPKARGIEVFA